MRIDVVGKDVRVTDNIRAHAEEKGAKLPKYFDGTQLVTFTISKKDRLNYNVECVVDVERHNDFVAHADDPDILTAIDLSVHKATRQLTEFKERLKNNNR
ncbi:MAG: ribosome-associated translation inhibitor RaiA [Phycisphaeraceae bacterium]|nr:MAG: ribosome-associated translation inhibitor RaiA [Phycisphaeraceae bacterium]